LNPYFDETIYYDSSPGFTSLNADSIKAKIAAQQTDNLFVQEILQEFNSYYTDSGFLVFGNIHTSDGTKNIHSGLFWMIVRKTKDGWKIYGTRA
jgi:hypothetical protein